MLFSSKLNTLNTRYLDWAISTLWQASKRNRINHWLETLLFHAGFYSISINSFLYKPSKSGFLFLIFPTNLPCREIRCIALWFPGSPSPLQNVLNNFYCISHLHSFGTEVNLSTMLYTTVSSLAISYLSSFRALAWSGHARALNYLVIICHYSLYRFVLKPLLLTHQFKTVP